MRSPRRVQHEAGETRQTVMRIEVLMSQKETERRHAPRRGATKKDEVLTVCFHDVMCNETVTRYENKDDKMTGVFSGVDQKQGFQSFQAP